MKKLWHELKANVATELVGLALRLHPWLLFEMLRTARDEARSTGEAWPLLREGEYERLVANAAVELNQDEPRHYVVHAVNSVLDALGIARPMEEWERRPRPGVSVHFAGDEHRPDS